MGGGSRKIAPIRPPRAMMKYVPAYSGASPERPDTQEEPKALQRQPEKRYASDTTSHADQGWRCPPLRW